MERIMKGIAGILLMLLVFIAALAALLGRPWEKRADRPEELLVQYVSGKYYDIKDGGYQLVEDETMGVCLIVPGDQTGFPKEISFHFAEPVERPVFMLDGKGKVIWKQWFGGGTHRIPVMEEAAVISLAWKTGEEETLALSAYGLPEAAETPYKGKRLSVLGDSISAYENYIPEEYRAYYNKSHFDVQSMWWMRTAARTGMTISRVNACGGSGFTVPDELVDGSPLYADSSRCEALTGINGEPDVIVILLGANDYDQAVELPEIGKHYEEAVDRIHRKYPRAELCICTYYGFTVMDPGQTEALNCVIRETAEKTGSYLIDTAECGILPGDSFTLDGVHPNERGQALLGDYIAEALLEKEMEATTKNTVETKK